MQIYSGKSVFSGIAIGKICVYQKSEQQVKRVRTEDSEKEWARYNEAKEKALDQLRGLYEKGEAVLSNRRSGARQFLHIVFCAFCT